MALKDEILVVVRQFPGQTDTELEKRFGKPHQTINIACRELVAKGLLERKKNYEKNGLIGNYPVTLEQQQPLKVSTQQHEAPRLSDEFDEDAVKAAIKEWIEAQGWSVTVAWGKEHGVDMEARKGAERWLIEVKGPGSRQAMRHNYFLGILGETLQRMDDDKAHYSIAFPNMQVYRNLWERLPVLAKQRTGIDMLLVSENGKVEILK